MTYAVDLPTNIMHIALGTLYYYCHQWRFYVVARGHRPPNLAQAPTQIFSG